MAAAWLCPGQFLCDRRAEGPLLLPCEDVEEEEEPLPLNGEAWNSSGSTDDPRRQVRFI